MRPQQRSLFQQPGALEALAELAAAAEPQRAAAAAAVAALQVAQELEAAGAPVA